MGKEVPQAAFQALEVASKHGTLLNPNCLPAGRGFHFVAEGLRNINHLGGGLEVRCYAMLNREHQHSLNILCLPSIPPMAQPGYTDFPDLLIVLERNLCLLCAFSGPEGVPTIPAPDPERTHPER